MKASEWVTRRRPCTEQSRQLPLSQSLLLPPHESEELSLQLLHDWLSLQVLSQVWSHWSLQL